MARQNLQAEDDSPEERPGEPAPATPPLRGEEQRGEPRRRADEGEMAGEDPQDHRRGEGERDRRDEAGEAPRPEEAEIEEGERPREHQVAGETPVDDDVDGEDEKREVRRVEDRRLPARGERLAAADVRVPERNGTAAEFVCGERAPGVELMRDVRLRGVAEEDRRARVEPRPEDARSEQAEEDDAGGVPMEAARRGKAPPLHTVRPSLGRGASSFANSRTRRRNAGSTRGISSP